MPLDHVQDWRFLEWHVSLSLGLAWQRDYCKIIAAPGSRLTSPGLACNNEAGPTLASEFTFPG